MRRCWWNSCDPLPRALPFDLAMTTDARPAPDRTVLLGRDRHREAIAALLAGAVGGTGGALVLVGAPGVGKTALLDAAALCAEADGMTVLRGTGVRSEMDLPYAGLHQLACPLMAHLDQLPASSRELLHAAFGMAPGHADRFRVALATLDLMSEAAATRPLLLNVDDAHWLDEPSAAVLAFVGRRLAAEPIGLLAAVRDEAEAPLACLPHLRVDELAEGAAQRLLRSAFPDLPAHQRTEILTLAQGNPLALLELPRTLAAGRTTGPVTHPALSAVLAACFTSRVDCLPEATRTLLLAAAADPSASADELLAAASAVLGTAVAIGDVQPAIGARLVDLVGGRVVFTHPLIGSAIYQAAAVQDRHAVHRAIAAVVGQTSDRGLWHRAAAALGRDDALADELDQLACRATALGAPAVAVDALDRAAALTGDARRAALRLLTAAERACEIGRAPEALALLARADRRQWDLDGEVRAMVVEELVESTPLGDATRLPAVLALSHRLHDAHADDAAIGLLWNAATKCWRANSGLDERRALLTVAAGLDLPADHLLPPTIAACLTPDDKHDATLTLLAESPGGADLAALCWRGCAGLFLAGYPRALEDLTGAIVQARIQGQLALVARLGLAAAQAAIWSGQLARAAAAAQEAQSCAEDIGLAQWADCAEVTMAVVRGLRGDYPHALAVVERAERDSSSSGDHYALADWQHGLGLAALGAGEYERARAHLERILDPQDPACHYGVRLRIVGDLAEAIAATHGRHAAHTATAALLDEVAGLASPGVAIAARYAAAVTAPPRKAADAFDAALAADLTEWPLARARLLLAYGSWLRGGYRPVDARAPLRAARDTFDLLGTTGWARRARAELTATGEVSDAGRPPKWSSLTAQEWQIATMAAAGLTNRQIGQQLFLSHRTVGSHLYHLFPKLGVTARSQLADALAELADPDGTGR